MNCQLLPIIKNHSTNNYQLYITESFYPISLCEGNTPGTMGGPILCMANDWACPGSSVPQLFHPHPGIYSKPWQILMLTFSYTTHLPALWDITIVWRRHMMDSNQSPNYYFGHIFLIEYVTGAHLFSTELGIC